MLALDDVLSLQDHLKRIVADIALQPEFRWREAGGGTLVRTDADGTPAVRVAVANARPDVDIWKRVRSPAAAGLHPLTFRDIWDFYAANNVPSVSRDGSPNYLAMPEDYDNAQKRYTRAVVISVLLPISQDVFAAYAAGIDDGDLAALDTYTRSSGDVSKMVSLAVERLSIGLLGKGRVVVPMTVRGASKVEEFTRSQAQRQYHGPCNNVFPQNSVAVLTGLMQFGVSRLPMRDEVDASGTVARLMGHYASLVLFDDVPPVTDGAGGVRHIDDAWVETVRRMSDFTDVSEDVLKNRYCAYNVSANGNGSTACGACIKACPAGAVLNSVPEIDGTYPERIRQQKRRFDNGFLKFDFANCAKERNQKKQVYAEYACGRCVVMCAANGKSTLGARA